MNHNISVIFSKNPKERIPLLLNILYEYGINQGKSVHLQSFDVNQSFYVNHLVSLISKIDFKLVESYMFPIDVKVQLKEKNIDSLEFVSALEKIRTAQIKLSSSKPLTDESWLDYVFDLSSLKPFQVIIIDNFGEFIDKSNKDIEVIMKTIEKYSKKYKCEIVLFINDKDLSKYSFPSWKVAHINEPLVFKYDSHNHNIVDIVEKE